MSEEKNKPNRAEELFRMLADEEPPIDEHSDTAPSRTSPRSAVSSTQPVKARAGGGAGRYILLGVMGVALLATIIITVLAFSESDTEDPQANATPTQPESDVEIAVQPSPTLTAPPIIFETATPAPTSPPVQAFEPIVFPTAETDVVGSWLLTPVGETVQTSGSGAAVQRQSAAFTITNSTGREDVIPYTVQRGDTLSGLANYFGLDMCTLVWSNPRNLVSPLRPGNVLHILPIDGALYWVDDPVTIQQVADTTGVDVYDIIDSPYNEELFGYPPETVLAEGMKIVAPGGSNGDCNIWTWPGQGTASGETGSSGSRSFGGSLWGCSYSVDVPGFPANRPVQSRYNFTQGFTAVHSGVDLSAVVGTPVHAAGSGAVAFVGMTDTGYGNAIVIDHGGSYSLYAHLSDFNVSCGQQVEALQIIGYVGNTGRSSGPHLHFEIRDAGFNAIDPTANVLGGF